MSKKKAETAAADSRIKFIRISPEQAEKMKRADEEAAAKKEAAKKSPE